MLSIVLRRLEFESVEAGVVAWAVEVAADVDTAAAAVAPPSSPPLCEVLLLVVTVLLLLLFALLFPFVSVRRGM